MYIYIITKYKVKEKKLRNATLSVKRLLFLKSTFNKGENWNGRSPIIHFDN